jgi:hypothetical protein
MDWTMYIAIGLCVLIVGSLVVNYLNFVTMEKLRSTILDHSNKLDALERNNRQNLDYTDHKVRRLLNDMDGLKDHVKYMYFTKKETNTLWDIHNERLNLQFNEWCRLDTLVNRLVPLAPLADKFDIKRKMKFNKEYDTDLKSDLKEIERELKDLT